MSKERRSRAAKNVASAFTINVEANEVAGFTDYVWHYYGDAEDGWGGWGHDTTPITRPEIETATEIVLRHYVLAAASHPLGCPARLSFDGGSHDREIVKDIILVKRGVITADQAEHGHVVALMLEAAA